MDDIRKTFEAAILSLDRVGARELLTTFDDPLVFIEEVLTPCLQKVGDDWSSGDLALAQVYMSSRICEELIDSCLPAESAQRTRQPAMAIAVLEDYHNLGKVIIKSTLRANGFELSDFGRQGVDELVENTVRNNIRILLVSVLMLPSALHLKQVTERLREDLPGIKVIVGGAPFRFDTELYKEVGADFTGENSGDAIRIVKRAIEEIS